MVEVCDGKSRCNEGGGSWSTAGRNNQRIDFGDPCFGIWKYINVTYVCRSTLPAATSSFAFPSFTARTTRYDEQKRIERGSRATAV
ncbi:MAG: hypothetical protein WDW36_007453 [Sanguina aurantia]